MPLRPFRGKRPRLGEGVYIDPSAQVIGDVRIGRESSVWMNAVVRGDVHFIEIGSETNIQDGCIMHVTRDRHPLLIGNQVTFGHGVIAHGCTIGSRVLLGIGSRILDRVEIGDDCIVAAGSVVTEGTVIPAGHLAMGTPARVRRPLEPNERARIVELAENYREYRQIYLEEVTQP